MTVILVGAAWLSLSILFVIAFGLLGWVTEMDERLKAAETRVRKLEGEAYPEPDLQAEIDAGRFLLEIDRRNGVTYPRPKERGG